MVYKKYIKRNGKVYGPYYYKSYRENGKVITKFISGPKQKKINLFNKFLKILKFYKKKLLVIYILIIFFLFIFQISAFSGSGSGTSSDPYQITNCALLNETRDNLTAYYILMNDIDFNNDGGACPNWTSGLGWEPIGNNTSQFKGSFDGNNKTISFLFINRSDENYIGLFGEIDGTLRNLGLINVSVIGSNQVGSLAGDSLTGTINKSYSSGTVNATNNNAGGLVGSAGDIFDSYAKVDVNVYGSGVLVYGGGLSAMLEGVVNNSYATGNINVSGGTSNYAAGLVARISSGSVSNSFATGNVIGGSSSGGLVGDNGYGGFVYTSYYNNHSINPGKCVGVAGAGEDCTAIQNNQSYFYDVDEPPMTNWSYPPWSNANDGIDFPILDWQISSDSTPPSISITYPLNQTYNINVSNLNYTYSDAGGAGYCWWSNSSGTWNSTSVSAGTNWTGLISIEGSNTWTVYCNDSSGNKNSSSVTFFKDTIYPLINIIYPSNNTNTTNSGINVNYTYSDDNVGSCWYSNDTYSVNTTITCGDNLTSIVWSEGQHNVTIWINDTARNENSSSISFRIDNSPPYFTDISNISIYNNQSLSYDINASDDGVGVESYSINWSSVFLINITTGVLTNSSDLSIGIYWINVSVNDTLGNLNSSIIFVNVSSSDLTNPDVTNLVENPSEPVTYVNGASYEFNATVTDNTDVASVWLEFNGTNYTASNITANIYNVTLSDLSVGNYSYRWYANDSNNNINNSEIGSYNSSSYSDYSSSYSDYSSSYSDYSSSYSSSSSDDSLVSYCWDLDFDGRDNCNIGEVGDDGYVVDCNDGNANIYPGAIENCDDSEDNNCDGIINENCQGFCLSDSSCSVDYYSENYCVDSSVYRDLHDYSCVNFKCTENIFENFVRACDNGCDVGVCIESSCVDNDFDGYDGCDLGEVGDDGNQKDCNDNNIDVYPGAIEVCNNVDDDCDSSVDENLRSFFYLDNDEDGYGNTVSGDFSCGGDNYVLIGGDCNDNNINVNPEAVEVCDEIDNDCSNGVDDGVKNSYYRDIDGDGYGDKNYVITSCVVPVGYVEDNTDCNDADRTVFKNVELYFDNDGDGYGFYIWDIFCVGDIPLEGTSFNDYDIDDNNPLVNVIDCELDGFCSEGFSCIEGICREDELIVLGSICGNGIVEGNEECDDGNNIEEDGCFSNCRFPVVESFLCGNSIIDEGEECDDGNDVSSDECSSNCKNEYCGDGYVQYNLNPVDIDNGALYLYEECDDGNNVDEDGCSSECKNEYCGDGYVQEGLGENCDPMDVYHGCNRDCTTTCGDGKIRYPAETCDDGNTEDGDGCSSNCFWETFCGNGKVEVIGYESDGYTITGEFCDDGNLIDGDGCSAVCTVENPLCGNGMIDGGEDCDNGRNMVGQNKNTFFCSSACKSTLCGNGILEPGEECDDGNNGVHDGCKDCKLEYTTCATGDEIKPLWFECIRDYECPVAQYCDKSTFTCVDDECSSDLECSNKYDVPVGFAICFEGRCMHKTCENNDDCFSKESLVYFCDPAPYSSFGRISSYDFIEQYFGGCRDTGEGNMMCKGGAISYITKIDLSDEQALEINSDLYCNKPENEVSSTCPIPNLFTRSGSSSEADQFDPDNPPANVEPVTGYDITKTFYDLNSNCEFDFSEQVSGTNTDCCTCRQCDFDSQCPNGQVCQLGKCVVVPVEKPVIECVDDFECDYGKICNGGYCEFECMPEEDNCGFGYYCDEDYRCKIDECIGGECIEGDCNKCNFNYIEKDTFFGESCSCSDGKSPSINFELNEDGDLVEIEGPCLLPNFLKENEYGYYKCKDSKARLINENGDLNCLCREDFELNSESGLCQCPEGQVEDIYGNCICANGLDSKKYPDCEFVDYDVICTKGLTDESCGCSKLTEEYVCKSRYHLSWQELENDLYDKYSYLHTNLLGVKGLNYEGDIECGVYDDGCGGNVVCGERIDGGCPDLYSCANGNKIIVKYGVCKLGFCEYAEPVLAPNGNCGECGMCDIGGDTCSIVEGWGSEGWNSDISSLFKEVWTKEELSCRFDDSYVLPGSSCIPEGFEIFDSNDWSCISPSICTGEDCRKKCAKGTGLGDSGGDCYLDPQFETISVSNKVNIDCDKTQLILDNLAEEIELMEIEDLDVEPSPTLNEEIIEKRFLLLNAMVMDLDCNDIPSVNFYGEETTINDLITDLQTYYKSKVDEWDVWNTNYGSTYYGSDVAKPTTLLDESEVQKHLVSVLMLREILRSNGVCIDCSNDEAANLNVAIDFYNDIMLLPQADISKIYLMLSNIAMKYPNLYGMEKHLGYRYDENNELEPYERMPDDLSSVNLMMEYSKRARDTASNSEGIEGIIVGENYEKILNTRIQMQKIKILEMMETALDNGFKELNYDYAFEKAKTAKYFSTMQLRMWNTNVGDMFCDVDPDETKASSDDIERAKLMSLKIGLRTLEEILMSGYDLKEFDNLNTDGKKHIIAKVNDLDESDPYLDELTSSVLFALRLDDARALIKEEYSIKNFAFLPNSEGVVTSAVYHRVTNKEQIDYIMSKQVTPSLIAQKFVLSAAIVGIPFGGVHLITALASANWLGVGAIAGMIAIGEGLHYGAEYLDPGGPLSSFVDAATIVGVTVGLKSFKMYYRKSSEPGITLEYLVEGASEKVRKGMVDRLYENHNVVEVERAGDGVWYEVRPKIAQEPRQIIRFVGESDLSLNSNDWIPVRLPVGGVPAASVGVARFYLPSGNTQLIPLEVSSIPGIGDLGIYTGESGRINGKYSVTYEDSELIKFVSDNFGKVNSGEMTKADFLTKFKNKFGKSKYDELMIWGENWILSDELLTDSAIREVYRSTAIGEFILVDSSKDPFVAEVFNKIRAFAETHGQEETLAEAARIAGSIGRPESPLTPELLQTVGECELTTCNNIYAQNIGNEIKLGCFFKTFPQEGVGDVCGAVCRHRSALLVAMIEDMISLGKLNGKVSVNRFPEHVNVLFEGFNGKSIVIDPQHLTLGIPNELSGLYRGLISTLEKSKWVIVPKPVEPCLSSICPSSVGEALPPSENPLTIMIGDFVVFEGKFATVVGELNGKFLLEFKSGGDIFREWAPVSEIVKLKYSIPLERAPQVGEFVLFEDIDGRVLRGKVVEVLGDVRKAEVVTIDSPEPILVTYEQLHYPTKLNINDADVFKITQSNLNKIVDRIKTDIVSFGERGVDGYYEFAYDCQGRISSIKRAVDPTPLEIPQGSKKAMFEVGWVDGKSKLISLRYGDFNGYNPYANDILALTKAMYNQKPSIGGVKEFAPIQEDQRGAAGALLETVYGDPAYHIADTPKQFVGFKSLVAGAKESMSTGFKNGEKVYTVVRRTNTGQVVETLSAFKSDTSKMYEQVLRLKYNNPELEVVEVGLSGSVVREEGLSISGIVDSNNKLLYELLLHYINEARPEKGAKDLIAISVTKRHHQGLRIGFVEREGKKVGLHIAEPGQFVLEDPLAQEFIQKNGIKVSDGVMTVKDAVGKKIEVPTKIYDLELIFEGEPGVLEFAPSIYNVENLDSAFGVKFGSNKCPVAPPASATATAVIPETRMKFTLKELSPNLETDKYPKYQKNIDDSEILADIERITGNPVEDYYDARRYFVNNEQIFNEGHPIKNLELLQEELLARSYQGKKFIWSIDEFGDLYIAEPSIIGPELTHGILSYGGEVMGAGEIEFYIVSDGIIVIANSKTGHYVPRLTSERTPTQFNQDSLKSLEDYLNN